MPVEAVDLVDKLLQLNPLARLGVDINNDIRINYDALKSHDFFKGLNFDRIKNRLVQPPIPVELFQNALKDKSSQPMAIQLPRNDFDDFGMEPSSAMEREQFQIIHEPHLYKDGTLDSARMTPRDSTTSKVTPWKILMEGPVVKIKKSKVFSIRQATVNYHMILTDQPRLFMLTEFVIDSPNPQPQVYKKDILLYTGLKARLIKRNKFELVCSASRKQY